MGVSYWQFCPLISYLQTEYDDWMLHQWKFLNIMFKCFFMTKEAFWVEVKCHQMREQRSSCPGVRHLAIWGLLRAWVHAGTGLGSCTESTWIPSPFHLCRDCFHLCWQHQWILRGKRDGGRNMMLRKKVDLMWEIKAWGGMDTNPSEINIPFPDQRSRTGGTNMCFYFVIFQIKLDKIK